MNDDEKSGFLAKMGDTVTGWVEDQASDALSWVIIAGIENALDIFNVELDDDEIARELREAAQHFEKRAAGGDESA